MTTTKARARATAAAVGVTALLAGAPASADEQLLIKYPGDHPRYTFDAEPHFAVALSNRFADGGVPGLGFRGTVTLVQDGFVKTLNNSVGLGFGIDTLFYKGQAGVLVPIVMQWSFWLSTHWAVYGEPGIAFSTGRDVALPVFSVGGRYHFSERVALTIRLGYPAVSVGVSFLL